MFLLIHRYFKCDLVHSSGIISFRQLWINWSIFFKLFEQCICAPNVLFMAAFTSTTLPNDCNALKNVFVRTINSIWIIKPIFSLFFGNIQLGMSDRVLLLFFIQFSYILYQHWGISCIESILAKAAPRQNVGNLLYIIITVFIRRNL